MRNLWLLGLTGCVQMDDPGELLKAAAVEQAEAPEVEAEGFVFPELQVISSEELQAGADIVDAQPASAVEDAAPADTAPADTAPADTALDAGAGPGEVAAAPLTDAAPPSAEAPVQTSSAPAAFSVAWPMRLVKTLPNTNPPRAILGLPDGQERVVSPGTMLPEHGLVVMSIGPDSMQVAKITAQGDHAAVQSISMSAQY